MNDETFQFAANGEDPLEQAVRTALGGEGRPPSKTRVRAWIRAGDVRIEGRTVEDPAHVPSAGDRVVVAPGRGAAPSDGAGAGCQASIRHLDRHLVVAEWTPPSLVGSDAAILGGWLVAGLEESGVRGLCPRPVPDPVLRVGGLVAAALSPLAEARLAAALGEGRVHIAMTALARASAAADTSGLDVTDVSTGLIRVVRDGSVGVAEALADLRARGLPPLVVAGPGPEARRPLLAHVTRLALPHPSTGRDLAWTSPLLEPGSVA